MNPLSRMSPLANAPPARRREAAPEKGCPGDPLDEAELLGRHAPEKRNLKLVLAGVGLGLTALSSVPVASILGPHSQVVYRCLNGTQTRAEVPNLVESLLQGPRLSPKAQAILACEGVSSPSEIQSPTYRAGLAWEAMLTRMGGSPSGLRDSQGVPTTTAWPYGQAMAAALDQAKLTSDYSDFDQMVSGLEAFRAADGGYHPGKHGGDRYYDDNAWLGLVFMQAHDQVTNPLKQAEYLHKAESIFEFLQQGNTEDGGLLWKENAERPSYNTCALGPAIELAMHLYESTGNPQALEQARQWDAFLDAHLRLPSGLYADNVGLQFNDRDATLYAYNQGTPTGAKMLLYRATGDARYLAEAQQTARAALDHYGQGDRLYGSAPVFNAIMLRNLLNVPGVDARPLLDSYLQRVWQNGLDPASGLFSRDPALGSYEPAKGLQMIDQAGLVQLLALQGWNPADLTLVT